MNRGCWTGVRASLPPNLRVLILACARELALDTEPLENNWLFWRQWEPLSATTVEGFHTRLLGDDRVAGQIEIVEQLVQWKSDFDRILAHLNKMQK